MSEIIAFLGQHAWLSAGFGLSLLAFIANELHGNWAAGPKIGVAEAIRLINDENALVLDVRPAAEFKKGHIMNAVNFSLDKLKTHASELGKKDRPIIPYCMFGGNALEAAQALRAQGFSKVLPLKGGLNDWLNQEQQITTK
jgi:rhodanese-related sulfurtransferase